MDIVYISDFFYPQMMGGAEQNDHELLNLLEARGHSIVRKKSDDITKDFLEKHKSSKFIISNFVFLFNTNRDYLTNNCDYVLYTHDHQYLVTRDPSPFKDSGYIAPKSDLKHLKFYKNAKGIICQSAMHAEIVYRNLEFDNIYSVGGNLWTEETLDFLEELSEEEKQPKCSIMQSGIKHKNTEGAVQFCKRTGLDYELLMPQEHKAFLEAMSKNDTFVFFPQTVETLSRIICEARMMNCKIKTNAHIGAASEPWFKLKGKELVDVMRGKRIDIPLLVESLFE